MKRMFIGLFLINLLGCGNETFSPTYSESICVPAQNMYYIEQLLKESSSSNKDSNSCCDNSWVVSCCFGGQFICADGSSGVGCGCPSN